MMTSYILTLSSTRTNIANSITFNFSLVGLYVLASLQTRRFAYSRLDVLRKGDKCHKRNGSQYHQRFFLHNLNCFYCL